MRELARSQATGQAVLLEETHNVLVTASGPPGCCPQCEGPMIVRKTLLRQGRTLAHGTFRVHETEYVCQTGCSYPVGTRVRHRPGDLAAALLPDSSVGYDVMVHVGLQRYLHHQQREEICQSLERDHGVVLSTGETSRLAHLFLSYLERLHRHRGPEIRQALEEDGGWPLHIDATGEDGRGTLLVLYAGWRGWVLGAFKIPTENAGAIRPCIDDVVAWAGLPVAIVRDLGRAMIPACENFRSDVEGNFPILSCHYHFLADVGKDLLEPGHGNLRDLFRRFAVRPSLRALVRDLGQKLGGVIGEVRRQVLSWQEENGTGRRLPEGNPGLGVVRAVAQWALDYPIESTGQDFPFVIPYLDFYDRCSETRSFIDPWLKMPCEDPDVLRAVRRLALLLDPVNSEVPFRSVTDDLRHRQGLFQELREALRLVPKDPGRSPPPASKPSSAELKDIESDVAGLRSSLAKRREAPRLAPSTRQAINAIIDHLDRHGESLWGHVILLPGEMGDGVRLVERTNDILENFFRGMKQGERRRSGRKILTQDFEALPPAAALALNLARPDYVALLCGSLEHLPKAFATLDREDRERRLAGLMFLEDGPSSHPGLETARASLPLGDRRVVRTRSMNKIMHNAASG